MDIIKATKKDMPQIIKTINSAFAPIRDYDFDITKVQPKVYNSSVDRSGIHTFIKEQDKIACVAGLLPGVVTIDNQEYKFSVLGSVATHPEFQGKGYFKATVDNALKESQQNGDIFCMLTGLRHRYNYFGFEKCGFRYYFEIDNNFCKYQKSLEGLDLVEYKDEMLDDIYQLFLDKKPVIDRLKDNFVNTLQTSYSQIYVYKLNNTIVGYVTFSYLKNRVNEIVTKTDLLPHCVKLLFEKFNQNQITIVVNPFDKETVNCLDEFCENKIATEQIHFKVFDMVKFLQMVFSLNKRVKNLTNYKAVFKVDGETISINIVDNNIDIKHTNDIPDKQFTQKQFLRYMFSLSSLYECNDILPLFLDFSYADLF